MLGVPSKADWPEGHKLAAKLGYTFPTLVPTPLTELMPDAPPEAINLLNKILVFDPNERLTAQQCLEHEFFDGVLMDMTTSSKNAFKKVSDSVNTNKLHVV